MADAPERLDLAEDPMGGWWSAADAPPEARIPYVLASIADKHKRQRDRLLEIAKAMMPDPTTIDVGRHHIRELRAAIAACQEKGDPT